MPDDKEWDLGQKGRWSQVLSQHISWQLVNEWGPSEHDADFTMQSIQNHEDEYLLGSGLTFLATEEETNILECAILTCTKSCAKNQAPLSRNCETQLKPYFYVSFSSNDILLEFWLLRWRSIIVHHCYCPAKLRITLPIWHITMECARMHTLTCYQNDKRKYLSCHQQIEQNAIHTAVSAHPQAKPTEINVTELQHSLKNFPLSKHLPSKHVSASLNQ